MTETINTTKPAIKTFRLDELNPAPYNPHVISDDSLKGLENSIARFNCVEPIIVNVRDGKNVIVGGHARHRAMSNLHGLDFETDCVVVDLSRAEERLLNITLNNPKIFGEYDAAKLTESIEKIKAEMPGDTGLVDLKIEELLEEINKLKPENFGTDFELLDEDKQPFQQMTFTIADKQAEIIKQAIKKAKESARFGNVESFGNENSNGNALYLIVSEWAEQNK